MLDVLRHMFRAPTSEQLARDLGEAMAGRELLVACRLPAPSTGVHWGPQGHLHVSRDRVVWRGRHHSEMTFLPGEWAVESLASAEHSIGFVLVRLVSVSDAAIHQEIRVPGPDVALLRGILSSTSRP
jgi:hypothetical protein